MVVYIVFSYNDPILFFDFFIITISNIKRIFHMRGIDMENRINGRNCAIEKTPMFARPTEYKLCSYHTSRKTQRIVYKVDY